MYRAKSLEREKKTRMCNLQTYEILHRSYIVMISLTAFTLQIFIIDNYIHFISIEFLHSIKQH